MSSRHPFLDAAAGIANLCALDASVRAHLASDGIGRQFEVSYAHLGLRKESTMSLRTNYDVDDSPMQGRHVTLERLSPSRHGDDLFAFSGRADQAERFKYLRDRPPGNRQEFDEWLVKAAAMTDPLHFAVIDNASGKAVGRQSLMRIDAANGVAEIGHIYWGPSLARTPGATEAFLLTARRVLEDMAYRRLEWRCDAKNEPSRAAARRFGFEFDGIFKNHMIVKGLSRDTAWYSITDDQWPALRPLFDQWLSPVNFDSSGAQRTRLAAASRFGPPPQVIRDE